MSAKHITEKVKESPKETMFNEISLQLTLALPALKERLGEKKFDKRVKKAAKLLTEGIKTDVAKVIPVKKAVAGKTKKVKKTSPEKMVENTPPTN